MTNILNIIDVFFKNEFAKGFSNTMGVICAISLLTCLILEAVKRIKKRSSATTREVK